MAHIFKLTRLSHIRIVTECTNTNSNSHHLLMQVFADHETSLNPIYVPRSMLWNLQRRTVYFGTSISTIFKGKKKNQGYY